MDETDFEDYEYGCECELDFNCHLHREGPTGLERINHEYASVQTEIDAMHGM